MFSMTTISALKNNYMYLVQIGQKAVVIDPAESQPILNALKKKNLTLSMILNTHHHFDHVNGNIELKKETGCQIVGPKDERIPGLDHGVGEGDALDMDGSLRVIETPGHGSTDLSFYRSPSENDQGCVWTGDSLFVGGCGRLFEGSPEMMWNSLSKLVKLPDETRVYCGHEYTQQNYEFAVEIEPKNVLVEDRLQEVKAMRSEGHSTVPSTIGQEKLTNPFLRAGSSEMKKALSLSEDTSPVEVFAALRHRKDSF
ncbi:MAG: hydroxyacylglutathione hydrolase [Kiritimatiellae bacterium]|nr:hydroxyacylglutathione hydrolase [Kiritimatiellia bacterium]